MNDWRPPLTNRVLALAALAALLVACGSGGDKQPSESMTRNLTDPRGVPSATVPPTLPTPIAVTDSGLGGRRGTQIPDVYIVKSGDTLAGIATELGVDLPALMQANAIDDARSLRIGQQLKVPRPSPTPTPPRPGATPARPGSATPTGTAGRTATPGPGGATAGAPTRTPTPTATAGLPGTYTVADGDTACVIATRLGVSLVSLAEANGLSLSEIGSLRIGQVLRVPTTRAAPGC